MNIYTNHKTPLEIIKYIENHYDVHSMSINNVKIWDFLKYIICFEVEKKFYQLEEAPSINKSIYNIIYNYFWESNLVSDTNHFVLFTDIKEQRKINNNLEDKLAYKLIHKLSPDILTVINPMNSKLQNDYSYRAISTNRISLSLSYFNKIKNKHIFNDLKKYLNIDISLQYLVDRFVAMSNKADKFFKKNKVKVIFINCFYTLFHQSIIYAAKLNNIKVFEIQHGIISNNQYYYNPSSASSSLLRPDYLLSHGSYVQNLISKNYMDYNDVIPFGNYYLDYKINDNKTFHQKTYDKISSFKKIILISHQHSIEKKLFYIIEKLSEKFKDIGFVISLRDAKDSNINKKNIIIFDDIDIYDIMKVCDLHISVYSTCILESLYLGVPNIIININQISKHFLSGIIEPSINVHYCNTIDEIIDTINDWPFENTLKIKLKYDYLFCGNQTDTIKEHVESLK